MKNESVVGVITTLKNNRIFDFIMGNLVYIIVAILVLTFIAYGILKNSLYKKKVKKEDRLYYLDAMTNLKNRNYLNDYIEFWNSSKIYPQAIIVIDINKLKSVFKDVTGKGLDVPYEIVNNNSLYKYNAYAVTNIKRLNELQNKLKEKDNTTNMVNNIEMLKNLFPKKDLTLLMGLVL